MPNRILVVDDESIICRSLARLLTRDGYKAHTASCVADALELQRENPFPVIITDFRMPGETGDQLAEVVKREWPDTVVLMLSAYSDLASVIKILNEKSVHRYLVKPWDDEELLAVVGQAKHEYESRRYKGLSRDLFYHSKQALFEFDGLFNITEKNGAADVLCSQLPIDTILEDHEYLQKVFGPDWEQRKEFPVYLTENEELRFHILYNSESLKLLAVEMDDLKYSGYVYGGESSKFSQCIEDVRTRASKTLVGLISIDNYHEIVSLAGNEGVSKLVDGLNVAVREWDSDCIVGHSQEHFLYVVLGCDRNHCRESELEYLVSLMSDQQTVNIEGGIFTMSLRCRLFYTFITEHEQKFDQIEHDLMNTYRFNQAEIRRQVFQFDENLHESRAREFEMSTALYQAIENSELFLEFQPKFSNSSSNIVGSEALLRWNRPQYGVLSPAVFIPIAERDGQISQIGEWVICEVFRVAGEWSSLGYEYGTISINVSGRQLEDESLILSLLNAQHRYKVDPRTIILEVTETYLIENISTTVAILANIRKAGFQVSMDDFGTGYSSLSYLVNLPVDEIKLDRSFVSGIADSNNTKVMVNALIQLCHNLNLKVVAEGIEDQAQQDVLSDLDCDLVQGFFISEPLSQHDFENLYLQAKAVD